MAKSTTTVQEAGRRGGIVCRDRLGHEHYERIGKMAASRTKLYVRLGKLEIEHRLRVEGKACDKCNLPYSLHEGRRCPVVVG